MSEEAHQEWVVFNERYELRRLTNWNGLSFMNGTNFSGLSLKVIFIAFLFRVSNAVEYGTGNLV